MSSIKQIYIALVTQLDALTSSLPTEYENEEFDPPQTAYQRVNLLPATPANPTLGGTPMMFQEQGILQVTLFYPIGEGVGNALTRAEAIRDWFPRGASFIAGGITAVISDTPRIGPGMRDDDRYMLPIDIPYFSHIYA